jgi:hypothetical protein
MRPVLLTPPSGHVAATLHGEALAGDLLDALRGHPHPDAAFRSACEALQRDGVLASGCPTLRAWCRRVQKSIEAAR